MRLGRPHREVKALLPDRATRADPQRIADLPVAERTLGIGKNNSGSAVRHALAARQSVA